VVRGMNWSEARGVQGRFCMWERGERAGHFYLREGGGVAPMTFFLDFESCSLSVEVKEIMGAHVGLVFLSGE
jgi:hypothetical protein